jgi:hypothetical protein|tara:strand:+ start:375 stop:602 length:228 start_codon:yes stop_codon:yes gene_type:complete
MKTLIKDLKLVINSTEFKNDEIQIEQLLTDFIKQDRAEQLNLSGVVSSCTIKKEKVEDLGASYKELDRDIDDKFM